MMALIIMNFSERKQKVAKNRWISDLHWVREGQQTRSQKTQTALLNAAEALFVEHGAEATSVADIANKAGCSVGSVYHHFKDKKALMIALYNRMIEEYTATTQAANDPARWEGASLKDLMRSYLEFTVNLARHEHGAKKAGLEVTKEDPELRKHYHAITRDAQQGMVNLMMARADEIGHPDPALAVRFVVDQAVAMLKVRFDHEIAPSELAKRSDKIFVREMVRSIGAYLQLSEKD